MIVLHRARLRTRQKINLGVFLCLSLVMVIIAIIRVSKIHGAAGVDVPWEFLWQFVEASTAVIMGSLTVFRTLLTLQNKNSNERRRQAGADAGFSPQESWFYRMRLRRKKRMHYELGSQNGLPDVPSATITGLRTFIRRNNRDTSLETQPQLTITSMQDTLGEEDDDRQLITHGRSNFEGYPRANRE